MDFGALVPDAEIWPLQVLIKAVQGDLAGEMVRVNRAQEEGAEPLRPAKFQELARMRQLLDGVLNLPVVAVEPTFQLAHRQLREVTLVEFLERQTELGAELFQRQFGHTRLREDKIGRSPNRRQIV